MNKKLFIISFVTALIIICVLFFHYFNSRIYTSMKDYLNEYEDNDDLKKYIRNKKDVTRAGVTLILAIENDYTWNELSLSKNFIDKFNNKVIIDELENAESLESGNAKINNEDVIVIYVDLKEPIIKKSEYEPITVKYYFRYKINDNIQLDDIELVKKIYTNSMSGKEINIK